MGQGGLQGGRNWGRKNLGGKNFWEGYLWDSKEKLVGASVRHSGNLQYNLVLGEGRRTASFRGVPPHPTPPGEGQAYARRRQEERASAHAHNERGGKAFNRGKAYVYAQMRGQNMADLWVIYGLFG